MAVCGHVRWPCTKNIILSNRMGPWVKTLVLPRSVLILVMDHPRRLFGFLLLLLIWGLAVTSRTNKPLEGWPHDGALMDAAHGPRNGNPLTPQPNIPRPMKRPRLNPPGELAELPGRLNHTVHLVDDAGNFPLPPPPPGLQDARNDPETAMNDLWSLNPSPAHPPPLPVGPRAPLKQKPSIYYGEWDELPILDDDDLGLPPLPLPNTFQDGSIGEESPPHGLNSSVPTPIISASKVVSRPLPVSPPYILPLTSGRASAFGKGRTQDSCSSRWVRDPAHRCRPPRSQGAP